MELVSPCCLREPLRHSRVDHLVPYPCPASELPLFPPTQLLPYSNSSAGGRNRARTCDPLLVRQVLCQLSYSPSFDPDPRTSSEAGIRTQYRSEEHTSELQSRFGISYAVFCLQ